MKEKLKKYSPVILILVLLIISIFTTTTITTKSKELKEKEVKIEKLLKVNFTLSQSLKELQESKNVEITEIKNKDGSTSKVTKIQTDKKLNVSTNISNKVVESKKSILEKESELKEKSLVIKNPKKLSINVGLKTNFDRFLYFNYTFKAPFKMGLLLEQNSAGTEYRGGVSIGFTF